MVNHSIAVSPASWRAIPLVLALVAAIAGLASLKLAPPAADGAYFGPGIASGAAPQQSCVDDVSIAISWVLDANTYSLEDPPDYAAGDEIRIYYDVTNNSCHDIAVTVKLHGSASDAPIYNGDPDTDPCPTGCDISAGETYYGGNVLWDLARHPNVSNEHVAATVKIDSPADFSDVDPSNNTATSVEWINVVNPEPEPTPEPTATATPTPSPAATSTPSLTPTPSPTPTPIPSPAPTPTPSPTPSPTPTPIPPTPTPSPTPAIDIELTAIAVPDYPIISGEVAGIGATVANHSASGAGPVSLNLYVEDASQPSATSTIAFIGSSESASATSTIAFIGSSESASATLNWDTDDLDPGTYQLYVVANTHGDTDQTNNALPQLIDVVPSDVITALMGNSEGNKGAIGHDLTAPEDLNTVAQYPDPTPTPTPTPTPKPRLIDSEIISIASNPPNEAMPGEAVAILVTVRNNGPVAVNIPVQLTFPSNDKQPERKSPRVPPGATAIATFTWKTRNYETGTHTLRARLLAENNATTGNTSAELQFRLKPRVVTAAIADIAISPESPVVGEPIAIAVTVRNEGPISANIPVTLHFPSDDKQPETRKPRAAPGATGLATFTWRTSRYPPGAHTFRVELGATPATDRSFTVELLPPAVDFTVADLYLSDPSRPVVKGDRVEVATSVHNLGPYAGRATVKLHNLTHDETMYSQPVALGPGESGTAAFAWQTQLYAPGVHHLQASADAQYDANRSNDGSNTASVTILTDRDITVGLGDDSPEYQTFGAIAKPDIPARLRYSIVGIAISPESPAVSEPVEITVAVRNDGATPAYLPVTLHFPSDDRQPETRKPRAAPGATGLATFTWRTSRYPPGAHTFRVELRTAGTVATQSFTLELLPPAVDFTVADLYLSDPSRPVVKGDRVEVATSVRNLGPYAGRATVKLHNLTRDKTMYSKPVTLGAGESGTAAFAWQTQLYAPGVHHLQASADAQYDSNRNNDGSNTASVTILTDRDITVGLGDDSPEYQTFGAIAKPDIPARLRYSIVDILVNPQSPIVGEPVEITVAVRNDGATSAYLPVTLHFPSDDRQPATRKPRAAPGATVLAAFTWRTSRYPPGAHTFRVELGAAGTVAAQRFTVELLPPAVDFTIVELYPPDLSSRPIVKGDWVEVAAFVRNIGPYAGRATVRLRDLTQRQTLYSKGVTLEPGESKVVEFTWKTLRHSVGDHRLQVSTDAQYDVNGSNDASNIASVTILTDRDITVGLGNDAQAAHVSGPAAKPNIRSVAQYADEIRALNNGASLATGLVSPASHGQFGAESGPPGGQRDATGYWLSQAAQTSPFQCVRYQRLIGASHPRAVLCSNAAALVL